MDKQTIEVIKNVIVFLEKVQDLKKSKKKFLPEIQEKKKSTKKELEKLWFEQNFTEDYGEAVKQKHWRSYIKNKYSGIEYPPL